ncbi:MAG: PIN domain-containing protein [Deltaproteobacteria bacterium]|nr:PIN domain-containing protein [Deltaproteobacteria bacterium]
MLDPVLIDTGPLVACFNPDDRDYQPCLDKLRLLKGRRLATTLAIVTETLYLLDFSLENQEKFLHFMSAGVVDIPEFKPEDLKKAADLMKKYRDCPMDFGDATLVILASRLKTRQILTLDSRDFTVYRTDQGKPFEIM